MQLIRQDQERLPCMMGSVVSIGNYDGVHLGHQEVIREMKTLSRKYSIPATIVTFRPYPWQYFQSGNASPRLTTFRDQLTMFEKVGIDRVVCLKFDRKLANTEPADFVRHILVEKLNVQHIVVGNDFRFGKDRAGSVELLRELSVSCGFQVTIANIFAINGARVSSSDIRRALGNRDFSSVRKLLGRQYSIVGKVTYGDQRGQAWGFPTANICLDYNDTPLRGVFCVVVKGIREQAVRGIANVGVRPTVSGHKFLLEVHCFDFNESIYGQRIEVEFCTWLRDERKFDQLKALRKQIEKDVEEARNWFLKHHPND